MQKVQIRYYDNFRDTVNMKIEVQEMASYQYLVEETVRREDVPDRIKELKKIYPDHDLCEIIV